MFLTVPRLEEEDLDTLVEPDAHMPDDGLDGVFALAYINDEIPWFDMRHEVRDLMLIAVPGLSAYDELTFTEQEMPDDGAEACWFHEEPAETVYVDMASTADETACMALAAPARTLLVSAPMAPALLAMPEALPAEVSGAASPEFVADDVSEDDGFPMASAVLHVPEPIEVADVEENDVACIPEDAVAEDSPAVRFSFGPQEAEGRGWRVCFSF